MRCMTLEGEPPGSSLAGALLLQKQYVISTIWFMAAFRRPYCGARFTTNPMDRVELPRAVKTKPHVLDHDKINPLLKAASGSTLSPLVMLAAASGCRRGELLALQWTDVNFESGILSVTKSLEGTREGL